MRAIVTTAVFGVVLLSALATMWQRVDIALTDSTADWLTVNAALSGMDPWEDLVSLADRFDVEFADIGASELGPVRRVHPRTPAALLLTSPLALTSPEGAFIALTFLSAICYGIVMAWGLPSLTGRRRTPFLVAGILGVAATCFLTTLEFGTQSGLLLLLTTCSWLAVRSGASHTGGILLGIAGSLRIFPLLLVIPLWRAGERHTAYWTVGTFAALNVTGLFLLDLTIVDSVEALASAGGAWIAFSGNGSLAMPLVRLGVDPTAVGVILVAVSALVAWIVSRSDVHFNLAFAIVLIVALVSSPLSWEHYDLLLIPVVAVVLTMLPRSGGGEGFWWIACTWVSLQIVAIPIDAFVSSPTFSATGTMSLAGRLLLLAGVLTLIPRFSSRFRPAVLGA